MFAIIKIAETEGDMHCDVAFLLMLFSRERWGGIIDKSNVFVIEVISSRRKGGVWINTGLHAAKNTEKDREWEKLWVKNYYQNSQKKKSELPPLSQSVGRLISTCTHSGAFSTKWKRSGYSSPLEDFRHLNFFVDCKGSFSTHSRISISSKKKQDVIGWVIKSSKQPLKLNLPS